MTIKTHELLWRFARQRRPAQTDWDLLICLVYCHFSVIFPSNEWEVSQISLLWDLGWKIALSVALQLRLNVKISWWVVCGKLENTLPPPSITRTFSLTCVEQPAVPSRRMFLCCSSGFSCITLWECGDSLHLPLEIQRGSATRPVSRHYPWPSSHPGLGLNSAFLSCHTCLIHA